MRLRAPTVEVALVAANIVMAGLLVVTLVQPDDPAAEPARVPAVEPSEASSAQVPGGVLVVVAADSLSDRVVGHSAAEALEGELLAVPRTAVSAAIRDLSLLRPERILVLGGPEAVSEATVAAVDRQTSGRVVRLSGPDRYATAAKVATSQFRAPVRRVVVVSGDDRDALRALARAGAGAPVLFVGSAVIPGMTVAALELLRPANIDVLGGPDSVSEAVLGQLRTYASGSVSRVRVP